MGNLKVLILQKIKLLFQLKIDTEIMEYMLHLMLLLKT